MSRQEKKTKHGRSIRQRIGLEKSIKVNLRVMRVNT
jgi:hypothetical protein